MEKKRTKQAESGYEVADLTSDFKDTRDKKDRSTNAQPKNSPSQDMKSPI